MNKLILTCCSFLFLLATVIGQDGIPDNISSDMSEKIKSQRVAFITDKLQLTPAEAQSFWPLYNQYKEQEKGLKKEYRLKKRIANMSDQEIEAYIMKGFELEKQKIALKKEFFYKLKEVLPVRKIGMLQPAEKAFKRKVLNSIKKRKRRKRSE